MRIESENDPFWPIAELMKEAIAVHQRGACSECHQARKRSRIPCHNALRSPLFALNELIEIQLFARYCAAQRDEEKSRKGGRPNGVGMSVD